MSMRVLGIELVCSAAALSSMGSLPAGLELKLLDARARASSEARQAFASEIRKERPDDLGMAVYIASEERPEDEVASTMEEVRGELDDLTARAATRVRLNSLFSESSSTESICRCVGDAMFGDLTQESDDESFYEGNTDDFYDPRNSFLDEVVSRQKGIPITMSLVFREACRGCGAEMRLLNAPGHVVLCPDNDDPADDFVVDAFNGGNVLDGARSQVNATTLTGLALAARLLRNLRLIHERPEVYDPVRLLGAAERLLLIADRDPDCVAVPLSERAVCRLEVGLCLLALRDTERRAEAFGLLNEAAKLHGGSLSQIVKDPWFDGGEAGITIV